MPSTIRCALSAPNALLPSRPHGDSLGHDLFTLHASTVPPGHSAVLRTGVTLLSASTPALVALIMGQFPEPGNGNLGISQTYNSVGSELTWTVYNANPHPVEIPPYKALSRMFVLRGCGGDPILVDQLDETARGEKGFGSSGLK